MGLPSLQDKIKTLEQLRYIVKALRQEGEKVVFTNGCYDLIHVGHVRLLQQAKHLGDRLIVAINSDSSVKALKGQNKPLVSQEERAEVLAALASVDFVVIFNELDPLHIITELQPDVLVKGGDWTVGTIIGKDVVEQAGGTVISLPFVEGFSTTKIIERILKSHSAPGH
jgi:D-beta-D-heptose 7-phosphate kinase/D-beta-D-heptose 1-phosphate adenosyltransferase